MKEHGVSRAVVRPALAQLRMEGLVTIAQGRGSFVRERTRAVIEHRTLMDPWANLTDLGEVHKQREYADAGIAAIFKVEEHEHLYTRLQSGSREGQKVITRRIIPSLPLEEITPEPDPYGPRGDLITAISDAYGPLEFSELVRGVIPSPDEASALGIPPGAAALEVTRLTHAKDGRILMAEIERVAIEGTAYGFDLARRRTR